ncbi:MAG: hypothetical protein DRP85_03295 [Candidatus Makaraimicrobium thalassicum]|nr:MAG: hypothetical protein DRP85_03295 [Candidatus Omnitrophota bacterium]
MPLESATVIAELEETYPLGGDPTAQGDNHLRLLKSVLQLQFPGELGGGFDIPIVATETELNHLVGVSDNIQDQFNALGVRMDDLEASLNAPPGTVLVFYQAVPPLGWTQITGHDDSMLRITDGVGGGAAGSDSGFSYSWAHNHTTPALSLTEAQLPSHYHHVARLATSPSNEPSASGYLQTGFPVSHQNAYALMGGTIAPDVYRSSSKGSGQAHAHGNTGNQGSTFTPKYVNTIIASKD